MVWVHVGVKYDQERACGCFLPCVDGGVGGVLDGHGEGAVILWILNFICLFGVFRPPREFLTHSETSLLPVKGCKFWLMYWWSLSSEGSLTCHTYCDTGLSPKTRDIHTCCRAFGSGTVTACFNDLGLSHRRRRPKCTILSKPPPRWIFWVGYKIHVS